MRISRFVFQIVCLAAFLLLPAIAGATIIIDYGLIGGSGDVENVLYNGAGTTSGPAFIVTGRTNQTAELVNFTGLENLITPANGQARIEGADDFFDYLKIELADSNLGFAKIQFNLDSRLDGSVNLTFTDQFNEDFSGIFDLDGSGQNFFTAYSDDNQVIIKAVIQSIVPLDAFTDIQQVRLGPTARTQPIPEPATMLLLGSGLIGLAGFGRKKFFTKR